VNGTSGRGGPNSDGLRRIFLQNFLIADGKVRPRTGEEGLPPAALRIISPCDLQARFAMRGDTRWAGYLIHVTGTCDEDTVNLVTDVATTVCAVKDHEALAVIHARLARRALLPAGHLADGGYITLGHLHAAAGQQITMAGPPGHNSSWQARGNTERQHAVAAALAPVRAEGLEPRAEDLALFAEVAAGRLAADGLRERVLSATAGKPCGRRPVPGSGQRGRRATC
jgi:antitoxin VbhA-like protein